MVIFQYNLYIFAIHLWTVLYTKPCYNELCYKEVVVYYYYYYHFPETIRLDISWFAWLEKLFVRRLSNLKICGYVSFHYMYLNSSIFRPTNKQ